MNDQNPRQIALELLKQRRPGGAFTEDLLERALKHSALAPVDRGLCQELVFGVIRWQAALDWLVERKTDGRPQIPTLHNLLRLGLYQIFWLDRIPHHAAVHETVELARSNGFGAQAGFVNAVLRGYLRETESTRKLLAGLKTSQPAIGWSQPRWLIEKWQKRWDDKKTRKLLEWNNTPPKAFARVNTLQTNAGKLLAQWRRENVEYDFVRRDWLEENLAFELKSHPPLLSLESFQRGWFYIQDPGTLLAVAELNPQPGETILDLCAAPGGKTTFMAQRMNNQGSIVAQDISEERLNLVRENCRRLGVSIVNCQVPAAKLKSGGGPRNQQPEMGHQKFDRILVDAPCSNTGVMRRRMDLRWRIRQGEFKRLQQTQLDLLKRAAQKLKPGGVLVYSTCSLEAEENQVVMKEFLSSHKGFILESERELLPFADNVDGAFVARLKSPA